MSLKTIWQQFFPSAPPTFTEADLAPGSQAGKVFIVTGANSGIGKELAKFLYPTGATIYLAGRSEERIAKAIAEIEATAPATNTKGTLKSLHGLDFSDLRTVKPAVEAFAAQEKTLHVIWNNAAMGCVPGSSTPQGLEAHMGANAVGPFLFTSLLLPFLRAGAKSAGRASRVVWTGSVQIEMNAPPGGIDFPRLNGGKTVTQYVDYAASKCGNLFLAHEAAARWGGEDIISVCQNPGNLYTAIYAGEHWLFVLFLRKFVLYDAKYGAYTMMFAGFSDRITAAQNGCYIWPFGVIKPNSREDVYKAIGEGKAAQFWEWCEEKVKPFM
ncbi:NAD(P)-binding protein [Mytilinidion resinicola]|uniref:NAD(P)-binding protein n=1 Tax=Mytilinidion resinicola TaxID=574789 RepID=A0A6A6Y9H7_9PEZI|nr:NAD(P)-binding protein [Mytilinidion resinicola]KAF2805466.1 NAD(P)-binding protein [Mytilinidion resinicola]